MPRSRCATARPSLRTLVLPGSGLAIDPPILRGAGLCRKGVLCNHSPVRSASLALLLVLTPLAARAEERVLRLGDRLPFALVVGTPTGESAQARSSDIIRLVSEEVRAHTVFNADPLEPTLLAECKGRLLCLVQKVVTAERRPRYLLVISNVTRQGESDRMTGQLIDVDRASDIVKRSSHEGEDWEAEVEASLNDNSTSTGRANVSGVADAERVIKEWFGQRFQPVLEEAGYWEAWGELVIETSLEGLEITIDGAPVGATAPGETRVQEIRAGSRSITFQSPAIERFDGTVEIQRGTTVRFHPDISTLSGGGSIRTAVIIGGAVTAAIGVAVSAIAIGRHSGGIQTYCFQGSTLGCSAGSGFESTAYSPSRADRLEPVNPSGLLLLPLGYSLVGAGAAWSFGSFFSSDQDIPWLALAVGAGVGVAAYAVSAAASVHAPGAGP